MCIQTYNWKVNIAFIKKYYDITYWCNKVGRFKFQNTTLLYDETYKADIKVKTIKFLFTFVKSTNVLITRKIHIVKKNIRNKFFFFIYMTHVFKDIFISTVYNMYTVVIVTMTNNNTFVSFIN